MTLYRCISADPPWNEKGAGKVKRGADRHYPTMKTPDIIGAMLVEPIFRPDPSGCHLWLWVTDNYLTDGLLVMEALGFRYVRTMVWAKVKSGITPIVQMGLGQYLRGAHEICLFGVMGRLKAERRDQRSLFLAERTKHSKKPDEAFEIIEAVSPGPRLEMFARTERAGWDSWGNEL